MSRFAIFYAVLPLLPFNASCNRETHPSTIEPPAPIGSPECGTFNMDGEWAAVRTETAGAEDEDTVVQVYDEAIVTVASTGCANTLLGVAWLSQEDEMVVNQSVVMRVPNLDIVVEVNGSCNLESCAAQADYTFYNTSDNSVYTTFFKRIELTELRPYEPPK